MRMTALCRHQAPALHVPMSTGGWITVQFLVAQLNLPPWFLVEIMRANKKARFQLLSSCDAAQDPGDPGTMCSVECYRVTQGYSIPWLRLGGSTVGSAPMWRGTMSLRWCM